MPFEPSLSEVYPSITLLELQSRILQKSCQQNNKQITQMVYRLPIAVGKDLICYNSLDFSYDKDVSVMFDCHAQFPEFHIMEFFVILHDSALSSKGFA